MSANLLTIICEDCHNELEHTVYIIKDNRTILIMEKCKMCAKQYKHDGDGEKPEFEIGDVVRVKGLDFCGKSKYMVAVIHKNDNGVFLYNLKHKRYFAFLNLTKDDLVLVKKAGEVI